MKLFKLSVILFVLVTLSALFSSCEKDGGDEVMGTTLVGTWRLTESLMSTGVDNSKYQKVSANPEQLLVISDNGKISGNVFNEVDSYKVLDNPNRLEVTFKANGLRTFFYKLSGNALEINGGGCIEACGSRFVRIK